MAEHFRTSYRRGKTHYFGHCWIKSRFGEKRVERYLQGGVRSCDNEEAREFYDEKQKEAIAELHETIETGDLSAAIAQKKSMIKSGELF